MSSTEAELKTDNDGSEIGQVTLHGVPMASLRLNGEERLCLAQISSRLLSGHTYNDIHNRRVALGITCVQCTPRQLDSLRRFGAMPASAKRCGTITRREAERLVRSFLGETERPRLPSGFQFNVGHACGWGCRGSFWPDRYTSSRARCVMCWQCREFFSPNKFIFHCHRPADPEASNVTEFRQPDAANFNAWRRHLTLADTEPSSELLHSWEDVKALYNGGSRLPTERAIGKASSPAVDDPVQPSSATANSAAESIQNSNNASSRGSSVCGEVGTIYSFVDDEPPAKIPAPPLQAPLPPAATVPTVPTLPTISPLLWARLLMLTGAPQLSGWTAGPPPQLSVPLPFLPPPPPPPPPLPLTLPPMPLIQQDPTMYFYRPACLSNESNNICSSSSSSNVNGVSEGLAACRSLKRRLSDHSIEAIMGP